MNEFELLRQFGAQVEAEAGPNIDVGARVIQRIKQKRSSPIDVRLSLASVSVCALSAVVIAAAWTIKPANDSFASLANAAAMTTGPGAFESVIEPSE